MFRYGMTQGMILSPESCHFVSVHRVSRMLTVDAAALGTEKQNDYISIK